MISAMPPSSNVEVLLSTHNGERYIATQLASILSQLHTDIRVLVRDDGSIDGTVALVQAMAAEDPRVRLIAGSRLGWQFHGTARVERQGALVGVLRSG